MGMPITVEIVDDRAADAIADTFSYFTAVDARFSTYKDDSEISRINQGLPKAEWSEEMQQVLALCAETKQYTNGYFDIRHSGKLDPSGLVKGWAVLQAAEQLAARGYTDFYIEAGGDIEARGHNEHGEPWQVGIRNPFQIEEIIQVIALQDQGVATSGTYIRGQHIYNPHAAGQTIEEVRSLTVIGPTVYDADRFATAAFAMGRAGIAFIERLDGFEGYMVDDTKTATLTSGWETYVTTPA